MYIDEFVEDLSNCIGFISGDELILKKMRYDFEYEIRTRNRDKKLGAIKWDLDDHCIVILLNNKSYSFDRSELTIEKTKEIGKMINKAYYNMKESSLKEFTHTYKFEIQWNTGDEYWDNFPDYDEYEGTIEGLNDYLNSQLSEEDPPACFDKEAWRELMNGETVYDETGARYSVKLMDNVNESLENAKKLLKENGYILEEAQRLDEWGKTLATLGLCLAMVLGIRACNGKWSESALKNINTKQGNALQLFNEYNAEEFGGILSEETSMARAVFGAVIQYAQKNNCSIADAAKRIKKQFVGEWRAAVSPDGVSARITSVLSTHDDDYGDIVMVSFRYQVGSGEHTSYKSSEVIIPASAASNYNKHVPVEHYKEAPAETPAANMHYSQY